MVLIDKIISDIIHKLQNREIIFFVGSAISTHQPSNILNVSEIKLRAIRSLCGKKYKKYFNQIYLNKSLEKKIESIQHEEFLERIYKTIVDGEITLKILDCLKLGKPNQNHFSIAQGLGKNFDIVLTTNQDTLIENALEKCSVQLLETTRYGDKIYDNGKIIKLHGCVEKQKSIVTLLTQLIKGLPKKRSKILRHIIENNCVFFSGYSGRDDDIFRILYNANWKKIYWNIESSQSISDNVEKLYKKNPKKFILIKHNLNDLFAIFSSELGFDKFESNNNNQYEIQCIFDEWANSLGKERLNVLGRILSDVRLAKYNEALNCFQETLNMVSEQTDEDFRILANTHRFIADTYMDFKLSLGNNYDKASKAYSRAIDYYSEVYDNDLVADSLVGLGESYRHRARYKLAIDSYKKALRKLRDRRDINCVSGRAKCHMADVFRMQDYYDRAITNYRKSHQLFKRYGLIQYATVSWIWLGEVFVYKGEYGKASWYNSRARKISFKYNFEQDFAWAKFVEADINKYKGTGKMKSLREDKTEELDKVVKDLNEEFGNLKNRLGQAWCNQMLAELYRLKRDYGEVKKKNKEALKLCGKNGVDYRVCFAYILLNEAEILRAGEHYNKAIKKYEEILNIKIGDLQRHHAHALLGLAETRRMNGTGNEDDYYKALKMYRNIHMRHGIVHTLIGLTLFTGLNGGNPIPILRKAEDESLKVPKLKKELVLVKKLKRECLKNHKEIFSYLHPLEFP